MTSNASSNRKRINQRLVGAPAHAVLTSAWLKEHGISSKLAGYYANSGWLHRVGDGAFTVQPAPPTWLGAIFGLQQKSQSFHPGGRTALELSGLAHFLPLGADHPLYLFGRVGERLPAWFKALPWSKRVRHVSTNFLPEDLGFSEHREGELVVKISAQSVRRLNSSKRLGPQPPNTITRILSSRGSELCGPALCSRFWSSALP